MKKLLPVALMALAAASCGDDSATTRQAGSRTAAGGDTLVRDQHTQSNTDSVLPKNVSLDLQVLFDQKMLRGTADWTIENKKGAKHLILDTDGGLAVDSVWVDGAPGTWYYTPYVTHLGKALHIPIQPATSHVRIAYRTSDSAVALKWLTPQQTSSKKEPFLYTQSEATHARTWVPCPDGPGIRFTYDARVQVPKGLLAIMSAENPQTLADSSIYHFRMNIPVPAYLMALAVGNLQFAAVDGRTGIYAEPDMIGKAKYELADMGRMVETAEKLYGPYRWGRYDVLILPPSFPIGGMENPKLTFATPTIIAGDRSLTNLISHELAHNWSGNLVTCATWNDIWMNEGFTVYLERRISEALMDPSYVDMLWELGYQDLETEVEGMGKTSPDTRLKVDVNGRDAEECLSDIPYEKGSLFLWHIEKTVGRDRWDPFLKKYFDDHAFKSITTEGFLQYMDANLIKGDKELAAKINANEWIYKPGIPANAPRANGARFKRVDSIRNGFLSATGAGSDEASTKNFTTHEWLHFLRKMPKPLSIDQMTRLDQLFHFTQSGNSEIADLWFTMAIAADYKSAYPAMEQFLSRVGRQKFLEPLYTEMMKTGKADMAKSIFVKYRENYHPIAQKMVEGILAGK